MSDLKILIHNLADLAPDYDRRHHYRKSWILWLSTGRSNTILLIIMQKKISGSNPQRYAFFKN